MKAIKYILLTLPLIASAQFSINIGAVDVQDRTENGTIAWSIGYDQFIERTGFGLNVRYTGITTDNYYSLEANLKQRIINENVYRLDLGTLIGYNLDDFDVYPGITFKNSVRIDQGTWTDRDWETFSFIILCFRFASNE